MVNCARPARCRSASVGSRRPIKPLVPSVPVPHVDAQHDGGVVFKTEPLDDLLTLDSADDSQLFDGILAAFAQEAPHSPSSSDPDSPEADMSDLHISRSLPATFSGWEPMAVDSFVVPGSLPSNGAWPGAPESTDVKPFPMTTGPRRQRRRDSHNAVERRRRDNINERIIELGGLVPESFGEKSIYNSKGETLRKAAQYIRHLVAMNSQMQEAIGRAEGRMMVDGNVRQR